VLIEVDCRPFPEDALARADFDVAIDFIADHGDDPNLQYVHLLSAAMQSPMSYSQHTDGMIDELFERQQRALDPAQRKRLTREFEQYAIGQAYNVMLFWWLRIESPTMRACTAGGSRPVIISAMI